MELCQGTLVAKTQVDFKDMIVYKVIWEFLGSLSLFIDPQTLSEQMTKTLNLKRHVSMCIVDIQNFEGMDR
jgi:hypothetical protein